MTTASVIDIPKMSLDGTVWDISQKPAKLLPQHQEFVLSNLKGFLSSVGIEGVDHWLKSFYCDGSLLTYQWSEDSDFDTYMLVDWDMFRSANASPLVEKLSNDDAASMLTKLFRGSLDGKLLPGTDHPVTYYVRGDELQQSSDAVYDLLNNSWLKQPPDVPAEYDPEVQFADVWESVQKYAQELDEKIGEVRRDVIDYEKLKEALKYTTAEDDKKYKFIAKQLEKKLKEINDQISDLMREFEEIHEQRKEEFAKQDEESAAELWKWSKSWAPGNLQYKFLERYRYISILHAIKKIYKDSDDDLGEEDISKLKEVLFRGSSLQRMMTLVAYHDSLRKVYYGRCKTSGVEARWIRRAALISDWDLSLISQGIDIMSPILFLSGNPVLIMIVYILKKLVEKVRRKEEIRSLSELL